jgi:hypothetical protein
VKVNDRQASAAAMASRRIRRFIAGRSYRRTYARRL